MRQRMKLKKCKAGLCYIYYSHLCERSESEEMITDNEDNDFDEASDDVTVRPYL